MNEDHDRLCDCPTCERREMLKYDAMESDSSPDSDEYYRCDGFNKDGSMIWTRVI